MYILLTEERGGNGRKLSGERERKREREGEKKGKRGRGEREREKKTYLRFLRNLRKPCVCVHVHTASTY